MLGLRRVRRADRKQGFAATVESALCPIGAARRTEHADAVPDYQSTAGEPDLKKRGSPEGKTPSQLIDARIKELGDWRGEILSRLRALVKEADPDVIEEWKWRGVPVWSHDGLICTGETYKSIVKMTFAKGAALKDPAHLFNSSLEGNTRRAIDFHDGDQIDEKALKTLVRAAVTLNKSKADR